MAGKQNEWETPYSHSEEGYAKLSQFQRNTVKLILPAIIKAAKSLNDIHHPTFTVVDYGAADGLNSIPFINAIAEELHDDTNELTWKLNDTHFPKPEVSMPKLQATLLNNQATEEICFPINPEYVAGNFYTQVVPNSSVDLGISMHAVHWLSQRPPQNCNLNPEYPDRETKRILTMDWEKFLLARSRELKPGGRMVIGVPTRPNDRKNNTYLKDNVLVTPVQSVVKDMYNEGVITDEEYQYARVFSYGLRSEEELVESFKSTSNVNQSLHLIGISTCQETDIFYIDWWNKGGEKDAASSQDYVVQYMNLLKSYLNSIWKILISTRSQNDYHGILEIFYGKLQHLLQENLGQYNINESLSVIEILKC